MVKWFGKIINRIRLLLQRPRRVVNLVPSTTFGRSVFPRHDQYTLADEGYRKNIIVYRCIREIAESAAEPIIEARRRGMLNPLTPRHPLVRLLQRPNPDQSAFSFIESLVTYQQCSGNWYIFVARNALGGPVELWPLRPDRIEIHTDRTGEIVGYEYRVDDYAAGTMFKPEDIIHDKLIDPLDDYYGLSPIEVAGGTVDLDNDAILYLRQFFNNSATPLGIIKVTQILNRDQRHELKDSWEEQFQGSGAWHSVAVLDQDADYKPVGFPLTDLDLASVFSESEARICGAFGVPPILIGAKLGMDRSTFANYAEARRSFWIETLKPIYRRISDRLTFALAPEFGADLEIGFDYSGVGALQEDAESIRKTAYLGWVDGLLTKNEARLIIGQPEVEGGDVFRSTSSDVFTKEGDTPGESVQVEQEPINRLPVNVEGNGDSR